MDSTILNNTSVYTINSNEIFNYSPKRKISLLNINNNLSPLDKNFTYLVTIHPISPYSQDKTDSDFLEPNDIKCPNTFIPNDDYHYLNNDAFDWQEDSTTAFHPILSYDETCNYNLESLNTSNLYNCFSLFIYKNKIHQVINDTTSNPALVHCKIDLPSIQTQYNNYYHIILTRNDNIFTMHLILDRYSLFSSYHPELINRLSTDRHNFNLKDNLFDGTILENDYNISTINTDTEYNVQLSYNNNEKYVQFTLNEQKTISIEILPDEYHKLESCTIKEHYDSYKDIHYGGIAPALNIYDSAYNIDSIINVDTSTTIYKNSENGRFAIYQNLPAGTYKFLITTSIEYRNYSEVAFKSQESYNNGDVTTYNKPENIFFKIHTNDYYNSSYYNQNYKYKTDTVILTENINISNIINDNKLTLGYLERYPNEGNLLFKNSFKGYITEFSFYRDQSYLRKFNNIVDLNSFQYITDYTASDNQNLNQTIDIKPDFLSIDNNENIDTPWSNTNSMKSLIKNNNKIPLKSYINLIENNDNFSNHNTYYTYFYGTGAESYYKKLKPRKEYFTNFNIKDIILINENSINSSIINNPNDKITQIEYPKFIDNTSLLEYTSNDVSINNKTFCIFTFDILKNISTSDGYTIYDQKKYLMKSDYSLEEYNELTTYNEYITKDSTNNYIRPINFDINSNIKHNIINSLNNYILTIKNDINNLYVIKFVINPFRDNRYMFLYKISSKTILDDRKNSFEDNIYCKQLTANDLFNSSFDKITYPYYSNLNYVINYYLYQTNTYYYVNKPLNWSNFTSKHILYNNVYYSKEKQNDSRLLQFVHSNDYYDIDFNPFNPTQIYNTLTPTLKTPSYDYLNLNGLNYDKIRVVDLTNTVYFSIDLLQYINNYGEYLTDELDSILQEDGTIHNNLIHDYNIHYYIELYDSTNNLSAIVNDFYISQFSENTFSAQYYITKLNDKSYKIDYTNVYTNDIVLLLNFDFITNASDESKYNQSLATFIHEFDLSKCSDINVLPTTKESTTKNIFQKKYEELFDYNQSYKQDLPLAKYTIRSNISSNTTINYNLQKSDLLLYSNYEIGTNNYGTIRNDINEYIIYYNINSTEYSFHQSKVNINYEHDKRIISDFNLW